MLSRVFANREFLGRFPWAEDFPTEMLLISAYFYIENYLISTELGVRGDREISENTYLMMHYVNAGKPSPATPGAPRYFVSVSWRVLVAGRRVPSNICANTKWRRFPWPFPWKCRDGNRSRNNSYFKHTYKHDILRKQAVYQKQVQPQNSTFPNVKF